MRPYEVMVIFDVGAEAPAIQAVVDRLLETIRAHDGVPGHVDRWGRRPFAYEVKHRREGYYIVVELSGGPKTVAEIDRLLTLADEVLRFKVIRLPDKVAARLASGAPGSGRPGARGPASRGHSGRGPRADGGGRSTETTARGSFGESETRGTAEVGSREAAADATGPTAG
ncbi:MAG TPA: 30S ribosomal protein S6 [Acidimicrobiales bacterium]|nr:30S ribosomal protein S6 [Acidimicrobiales bacterium]